MEAIYEGDSDSLIWLKEADGPVPNVEPRKDMQKVSKRINGVRVSIEQQIQKLGKDAMPFIEANWSHDSLNFSLRSLGPQLSEVEKVIASMKQD